MGRWLVVAGIVFAILCVVLSVQRGDDQELQRLKNRESAKRTEQQSKGLHQASDLNQLRLEGRGQTVPPHLRMGRYPGNAWYVEDSTTGARANVPFKPGTVVSGPPEIEPVNTNPGFVGAQKCESCHREKYDSFIHTAHFRTSRIATPDQVAGHFESGRNELQTSLADVSFSMAADDDGMWQRASFFGWQFETPIDLVFGSSKMGESHVFWNNEKLFQANCSYLTASDQWINSPGFTDGHATYDRPILPGCIECHTTYVDVRKMPNHYTPQTLILGVSCERCHGPAQQHVEFHETHPDEKQSRFMSVPSALSRQQQLDVCGQCHSSNKRLNDRPAFQFRPGDRLEDHYDFYEPDQGEANEVHTSNQSARLARSVCFQESEMGCVECHNPHRNERGDMPLFSKRCLKCHQTDQCGMADDMGPSLADNCIDCHMPLRAGSLFSESAAGRIFPPLRDHHVRIDEQATRAFLETRRKENATKARTNN
ncbi:MAG: multiheme c-type cytochrome [Planctomycetota bacterium]